MPQTDDLMVFEPPTTKWFAPHAWSLPLPFEFSVLEKSDVLGIGSSNPAERSTENPSGHNADKKPAIKMYVAGLPGLVPRLFSRFVKLCAGH